MKIKATIFPAFWILFWLTAGTGAQLFAQTILEADGPGDTYELINSVLAPGYNVVEHPECVHPEFGRHIREVWDSTLNRYVFEFYIHVTPDNDRCINFDRQRMEIKTHDSSPANLKGVTGETVVYRWKFRLPEGFKPSPNFTHLHQIKAVGGDDDDPVFTLTARKGSPDKMELIHNNASKVAVVNLSLFRGNWVEVTERLKVDPVNGTYSIEIKNMASGIPILSYGNNKIMTIRGDNSFVRPKWGIYRSLLSMQDLRDEAVRFAGFYIQEDGPDLTPGGEVPVIQLKLFPNPSSGLTGMEFHVREQGRLMLRITDLTGQIVATFCDPEVYPGLFRKTVDLSFLPDGVYWAIVSAGKEQRACKLVMMKSL